MCLNISRIERGMIIWKFGESEKATSVAWCQSCEAFLIRKINMHHV